jgi:phosphoglycolate phosphatase
VTTKAPLFCGIKLVAFDLDGTLVDAFGDITAAANVLMEHLKRPTLTVEEVKLHVGHGVNELLAGILGTRDAELMDIGMEIFTEYYTNNATTHATVYDGVRETLEELRNRGLRTAVASNKPHVLTQRVVEQVGLAPFFDDIFGQSDQFPRKPAPDLLIHLMKNADANPETTLYVGDSSTDVAFALAAGVACVVVAQGTDTRAQLEATKAATVLDNMLELIPLLMDHSHQ